MKLADDEEVKALAISPDGTRLAAISGGKSWGVWDLTDGRRLFTRPHPEHVLSVAFCPDSIHCLIGDQFSTYAWDTATGTEIYTVKSGVTSALVVLPHGNRALVGGTSRPDEGEPLKLWGLTQDGPILARYPGQPCAPRRIALTADATRAVLAGEDGVVREAGLSDRAVRAVCWGDAEPLSAVGLSADHGLAASGSADGTVYLWDTAGSDRKAATIPLPYNYATCVAASGDGSGVLVGKSSRPVEVYSPGMAGMAEFLDGQAGQVQAMAFTPDRSLLVTGAGDGAVRLWQGSSGAAIGVLGRHDLDVRAVACSPDGRYALSVNGNEAKLWDLSRRILLWSRRGGATLGHGATFSADGRAAWAVTVHGRVIGWNVADGSPLPNRTQLQVAGELENTVLFLSDASRILGAENHDIVLWDARTGSIVRKFSGHTDTVETVALSPDSALIASGGQDQTVRVWDLASGKELAVLHEQALPIQHVCFSRDGRWLYSAATDDWIVAWQLDRAEQYRHFQAEARAARESLEANQDNPDALATLARWYQFRHRDDLANRLQNPPGPELGTARQ
jgi:WD40 repeat protein